MFAPALTGGKEELRVHCFTWNQARIYQSQWATNCGQLIRDAESYDIIAVGTQE